MPPGKDRWLSGRTLILTRHHGMTFKQAYVQAIEDWDEQERLHKLWEEMHPELLAAKQDALANIRRHRNDRVNTEDQVTA